MAHSFINPRAITSELIAVIAAALIFAYLKRNSPQLRAWLDSSPGH